MTASQESVVAMTLSLMTHFIGETSELNIFNHFNFCDIFQIIGKGSYGLVMMFEAPLMHLEKMLYAVVGAGKMPQIRKNKK